MFHAGTGARLSGFPIIPVPLRSYTVPDNREPMRRITGFILLLLITLSLISAGCTSPATPGKMPPSPIVTPVTTAVPMVPLLPVTKEDKKPGSLDDTIMPSLLARVKERINRSLTSLDQNISLAAKSLGNTGISGNATNSILGGLAATPPVIDAVTVTNDGVIAAAMPVAYQVVTGDQVANQSHIIKGLITGNPVLSGEFRTVEGFNASAIVYPVRSADGTLIGLVSVPFLPESLLSDAISPLMVDPVYEVTVIQADGRIIYATNMSQVGMLSLSDPLFVSRPDLIGFVNKVLLEDSGRGAYSVPDAATNTNKTVENYWVTISLHGTPWKIILDRIRE